MQLTKKEIPRISEKSKVSLDYMLALGSIKNFLDRIENNESNRSIFLATRSLKDRRVFQYQEKFSPEEQESPINEQNRPIVEQINLLVDKLNIERENLLFKNQDSKELYRRLNEIYQNIENIVYNGLTQSF